MKLYSQVISSDYIKMNTNNLAFIFPKHETANYIPLYLFNIIYFHVKINTQK